MFGVVRGSTIGPKYIPMFFKSLCEAWPVCPPYALLQSGHVSLYAPDLLYLYRVCGFGISSYWSVLLARLNSYFCFLENVCDESGLSYVWSTPLCLYKLYLV